ncbi:hypothetical protein NEFER03_1942 [Nematocida sp. LUAm3]|nr:hypothetical protein NEFER03_1942 [Nematocida sp. LUAm3]KAI5176156.1 hypothetical protein NEFER02_1970 [Nematocida sp. LUAm2]KAI5179352.1 hypothetical protein NEFER01_2193 [Nematocida sp. LUAm1]
MNAPIRALVMVIALLFLIDSAKSTENQEKQLSQPNIAEASSKTIALSVFEDQDKYKPNLMVKDREQWISEYVASMNNFLLLNVSIEKSGKLTDTMVTISEENKYVIDPTKLVSSRITLPTNQTSKEKVKFEDELVRLLLHTLEIRADTMTIMGESAKEIPESPVNVAIISLILSKLRDCTWISIGNMPTIESNERYAGIIGPTQNSLMDASLINSTLSSSWSMSNDSLELLMKHVVTPNKFKFANLNVFISVFSQLQNLIDIISSHGWKEEQEKRARHSLTFTPIRTNSNPTPPQASNKIAKE